MKKKDERTAPTHTSALNGAFSAPRLFLFALLFTFLFANISQAADAPKSPPFVPTDPIMPISQLKPGMKGTARTVVHGTEIVSFPVEILEILPRREKPNNLILIRASGKVIEDAGGIAAGMSGSPVYVNGKLVGAIGYGWSFSRHDLALVTPIEDMIAIWDNPERIPSFSPPVQIPEKPIEVKSADKKAAPVSDAQKPAAEDTPDASAEGPVSDDLSGHIFVQGLSPRMTEAMGGLLGRKAIPFGGGSAGTEKKVKYNARLQPGASITTALAWGDVEISAFGTLTAVSKDGRFIGFGHPFAELGTTSAALLEAKIARVIPGLDHPFKIGTTGDIIGILTQDRPQGIGGRIGTFAPAAGCTINFTDTDAGRSFKRSFKMVQSPYQFSQLASTAITGCIENLWGRAGGGSAKITTRFSGNPSIEKWKRTNIFFSEKDVLDEMLKEFNLLTDLFAVNQFQELRPFGIDVTVELTQDPRILYVEDVEVPKDVVFHPGDTVSFDITLRPWRKAPFKRTYSLVIPQKISGICELLVRGGGIAEENAEYMEAGWRSISSLPILLDELDAKETNDQMVIELRGQESLEAQIKKAKSATPDDLMNDKLKSEQKHEKMKEGSMRIVRTNYYVDGLIHRLIKVEPNQPDGSVKSQTASGDEETGDSE